MAKKNKRHSIIKEMLRAQDLFEDINDDVYDEDDLVPIDADTEVDVWDLEPEDAEFDNEGDTDTLGERFLTFGFENTYLIDEKATSEGDLKIVTFKAWGTDKDGNQFELATSEDPDNFTLDDITSITAEVAIVPDLEDLDPHDPELEFNPIEVVDEDGKEVELTTDTVVSYIINFSEYGTPYPAMDVEDNPDIVPEADNGEDVPAEDGTEEEEILTEDNSVAENETDLNLLEAKLDDIREKHYADIDEDTFDQLLRIDPTYNPDVDRMGTYGKWILDRFKKRIIRPGNFRRYEERLSEFDSRRHRLPGTIEVDGKTVNKGANLFNYKDIDEIEDVLYNHLIPPSNNELDNAKKAGKAVAGIVIQENEGTFLGDTDEWEVWQPLTWEGSKKLGAGSSWCTAYVNSDSYWKSYTANSSLVIFINKKDRHIKNQVQLVRHYTTGQFLNERDANVRDEDGNVVTFGNFIYDNKLDDVLENSKFKNIEVMAIIKNKKALAAGKAYVHYGGAIPAELKENIINVITPRNSADYIDSYIYRETNTKSYKIGQRAFYDCPNLKSIAIAPYITEIRALAFNPDNKDLVIRLIHDDSETRELLVEANLKDFVQERLENVRYKQ